MRVRIALSLGQYILPEDAGLASTPRIIELKAGHPPTIQRRAESSGEGPAQLFHRHVLAPWLLSHRHAAEERDYHACAKPQIQVSRGDAPVPCLSGVEGESYRYLLDTDEFQGRVDAFILKAKLNDFPNSLHESVQIFSLGVAATQGRNGGDIIAIFVSLDHNGELSLTFHRTILA
jgi:hypothetical protein